MKTSFATYWRELANGKRTATADQILLLLLAPFGLIYSFIQKLRATLYRIGMLKTLRLPRPVISIGNITVGGTGKTPVTAYIARLLLEQGYRVAVLSRGYGGSLEGQTIVVSDGATVMLGPRECGDEPYLLASTVPGLMVVIGADRYAAGQLAVQQLSPDIFLLDDGFQHLRLHRDLNILLLDSSRPFGNGWTLPAGMLREAANAAMRADVIILTRCPEGATVAPLVSGKPAFAASHRLVDALPLTGGNPVPLTELQGPAFLAFAGIAEPEFFFSALRDRGINIVGTLPFPDHAYYDQTSLDTIREALRSSGAEYAITTEKDGVKLKQLPVEVAAVTYLARLDIVIEEPAGLQALIRNLLP
ncbi:MAG: tetraacyldisaccharide 4'-kinase [Geobacteraceae bacterium]|nr:tetraacyldisaccharide 4'-kinase [Geobacteraceae bacterium]NTW80076.1 tetraacyldisaccharide 4'-kinase [Geobacteraceae bacterium]